MTTTAGPTAPTLTPRPFAITEPVAEGITVLEASAGTGKTHTVASLVVVEVAEGRPIDQLLVVTFTRKATGTLRERVWGGLAAAARALAPGAPLPDPGDVLTTHLRRGSDAEIAVRRRRLERAVSEFDTATIATTHGFCQQMLASIGVAGDAERDVEIVDDVEDLVRDAVDDLFVNRFHAGEHAPLFDREVALTIANAVIANPDAVIAGVDGNDPDLLRYRFARTLRQRLTDQKRRNRLVTFDDLLSRLDASVRDPARGRLVRHRLRDRFSMVIVDEFQDTDTVQWSILDEAFGAAPSRLVLVGDPKQAIYAFRGGDVHAYLAAAQGRDTRSLAVSWRSDQPLLDALDDVFAGAQLGHPDIVHRPLRARPGAEQARILGADVGAALTVRVIERERGDVVLTNARYVQKDSARRFIARDLAAEAVRMLNGATTLVERDGAGAVVSSRPLVPGDLAVLVRTHRDADTVRTALQQLDVPAVVHGNEDVLGTEAATDWLTLLRALERPSDLTRARALALTPFVGWDATTLATADDAEWDHLDDRVHDWIVTLRAHGASGLFNRIDATDSLSPRLLGVADGERMLSDLRQVAEVLDGSVPTQPSSIAALESWLADERSRARSERRRRLESDADAVAIHTIHGAKGLEFPVVLLPTLWEGPWSRPDAPPVFHDSDHDDRRSIGVGGNGPIRAAQVALAERERDDEDLRLLYVALTRAAHRVVVWWATAYDSSASPLARVLLGRDAETGAVRQRLAKAPNETAIREAITALAATAAGSIEVVDADPGASGRYLPPPAPEVTLSVRDVGRGFDEHWKRTSYSGLTAAAHDLGHGAAGQLDLDALAGSDDAEGSTAALGSTEVRSDGAGEPLGPVAPVADRDDEVKVDEPERPALPSGVADLPDDDPLAAVVPLGELPGGPRVGTMVHDLLERTDFTAADLTGAITYAAAEAGAHRHVDGQVDALVAGIVAAVETPLGPLLDDVRLRDLRPADRLDELAFDLPLAGGETPVGYVTMDAIADVFATLRADDPLVGYHEHLREPVLATSVRGFLTGSIDLVMRVGERHVVVDYKTNLLAPGGEALRAWHYRPDALAGAMVDAHYPLQAALYAVALHRYLRWRLADYDPARHLGGIAYLFLRGMTGADVARVEGRPCGVFAWHPPTSFVVELSNVLDRGAP